MRTPSSDVGVLTASEAGGNKHSCKLHKRMMLEIIQRGNVCTFQWHKVFGRVVVVGMLLSEWWRLNVETVMENSFSKPGTDSRYYSCVGHVVLGMVRLVSMTSSFVEAVISSPHQQVASDRGQVNMQPS